MKNFILPGSGLFLVAFLALLFAGAQAGAAFLVKDNIKVADKVTCIVNAIYPEGSYVRLNLGCGDRFAYTENAETIAGYVNSPGPLTCALYKSGSAICELRKK